MRRACVIGWPVEHSRSPLIHRYWLKQYGLDGAYEKEAVKPEDLPAFLGGLAARGYAGANVTLPHKEAALRLATVADEAARTIGAANTLWLDEAGRLNASNTDAYGFMTNLNAVAPGWNEGRRPVMVLGAGGAGRAVLHGLLAEGASAHTAREPDVGPRPGVGGRLRPGCDRGRLAGAGPRALRLRAPRKRDEPRHDRQGGSRPRSRVAAVRRRGRRSRL